MCPACLVTISGGLLFARKLGANYIIIIGLYTIFLSIVLDIILRKLNAGKVFFPYQRMIISTLVLMKTVWVFYILNQIAKF